MRELLVESLRRRFASYDDLAGTLDDARLGQKLDANKHKSLLEHLWCVVGARESYARALATGDWQGFSCSMSEYTIGEVIEKLRTSAGVVLNTVDEVSDWTEQRERYLLELSDHEVMHEGGVIRHMYAFELPIPDSVKWA